ncbi:MAG: hypothetical protein R3338_09575, partial [Thermoanaerobaculia bacterium]|nr:hypothetical protein [Thermoanaerobaculia bacterium]
MKLRGSDLALSLVVLALLAIPVSAGNEVPASWGELEPGPYEVGFQAFHEEDRTRGYWPLRDYLGRERSGTTYRPMQVSVWYPAIEAVDAEPLRYGDYVELQEMALGESHREELRSALHAELRDDFFGRFFQPDGPADVEIEAILDQPMAARRDAPPRPGPFPVVIHSGFGPLAQSVLLEHLASHGYVVLTVPMLGSDAAWFNRGSGTLEWWLEVSRDIAWLRAFASRLPMADVRRTAVIGMTGSAGMLDQMSSMQLSAIVGTEAVWRDVLTEAPAFEPARARIPILDITSKGRSNRDLLDRLVFADRWIVRLDEVEHPDFYQFRRLTGPDAAVDHTGYTTTARLTRRFLDAHLKGVESEWSETSLRSASSEPLTTTHLPAEAPIPSEREFLLLVREGKSNEAAKAYRAAVSTGHSRFFDPAALRTTAIFRLYDDDDAEGAAAALRILVDAYPGDVDGYRFLARALLALGDRSAARETLERASA